MKFKVGDKVRCICNKGNCNPGQSITIDEVKKGYFTSNRGRYELHEVIPYELTKLENLIYNITS